MKKYDVVKYADWSSNYLYAITADGEPTGLTLPTSCESVEMGREFVAWCDGDGCCYYGGTMEGTAPYILKLRFKRFLISREPAEEQPPEPEESTGASEYVIWSHTPAIADGLLDVEVWVIEHTKSPNLVSKTFESREDAEGYLKWYFKLGWKSHLGREMHRQSFGWHEDVFKRFKSETADPTYVCPYCGDDGNPQEMENGIGQAFLECQKCYSRCPVCNEDDTYDESWIKEPE